jgi:hypothetical protein
MSDNITFVPMQNQDIEELTDFIASESINHEIWKRVPMFYER